MRVFNDTVARARAGGYDLANGTHVDLDLSQTIGDDTKPYDSEIVFSGPSGGPDAKAPDLSVVEGDCLETARKLAEKGEEVCVLNMANNMGPGGSVHKGAGAQEEHLFRSSDYFRSLYRYSPFGSRYGVPRAPESPYPLHERFGGVFSRGVTVFRGPEREGYPLLAKPWRCNFVAVPALNRGKGFSSRPLTPAEESIVRDKIATILRICRENGQKTLVLSAFGCGAFGNPAGRIAELFREALASPEFRGAFGKVVFSILEDHNSPLGGNCPPFRAVFA